MIPFITKAKQVLTKVDLALVTIKLYGCFHNVKLSDTEMLVLSYFMVYGVNIQTKQLLFKSGVCKPSSIKTIMVKLKKLGLIYKDELNRKVYVHTDSQFKINDTVALLFKIQVAD